MPCCCSRRFFLTGLSSSLICANAGTARAETTLLCASLPNPGDIDQYVRKASSDNPKLDDAVINELHRLVTVIPVNPEFQYIDEAPPNAFAIPTSDVLGTKGTVLLGMNLLKSLLNDDQGGGAIAGICAHECGHIYQYYNGFYDRLSKISIIAVELHADFIAGYYMGRRGSTGDASAITQQKLQAFSHALLERTGYGYADPSFHGFPGDRIAAVDRGYFYATQGLSLMEACTKGEEFCKQLLIK